MPDAPAIHVVDVAPDIVALDLEGELDMAVAPAIFEKAEEAIDAGKHLIVNLSDATFIDSSTVHTLFMAQAAATNAGRSLVLQFGTQAGVERVLEITGAEEHVPTAGTREAAVELVRMTGF